MESNQKQKVSALRKYFWCWSQVQKSFWNGACRLSTLILGVQHYLFLFLIESHFGPFVYRFGALQGYIFGPFEHDIGFGSAALLF